MSTEKPKTIKQQKNEEIERLKKELKELEPIVGPCVIPISKEESDEEEDDKEEEDLPIEIQKPRKPRTEKQIEQFKKVIETKMKNASERKKQAEIKAVADKQELEEKLVKKAIAVKKKQIKKQKIIDDISDEEKEDDPVIQKMKPVKTPVKPIVISKYKFI